MKTNGVIAGKKIRVENSANPLHIGAAGIVEDETRNMIIIRGNDGKIRKVPKAGATFAIGNGGDAAHVSGVDLSGTIVLRSKK